MGKGFGLLSMASRAGGWVLARLEDVGKPAGQGDCTDDSNNVCYPAVRGQSGTFSRCTHRAALPMAGHDLTGRPEVCQLGDRGVSMARVIQVSAVNSTRCGKSRPAVRRDDRRAKHCLPVTVIG
jgi:hypothetical protein